MIKVMAIVHALLIAGDVGELELVEIHIDLRVFEEAISPRVVDVQVGVDHNIDVATLAAECSEARGELLLRALFEPKSLHIGHLDTVTVGVLEVDTDGQTVVGNTLDGDLFLLDPGVQLFQGTISPCSMAHLEKEGDLRSQAIEQGLIEA